MFFRMLGSGRLQKRRLLGTSRFAARNGSFDQTLIKPRGLFDHLWSWFVRRGVSRCLQPVRPCWGVKMVSQHFQANSKAHRLCLWPARWLRLRSLKMGPSHLSEPHLQKYTHLRSKACTRLHQLIAAIPTYILIVWKSTGLTTGLLCKFPMFFLPASKRELSCTASCSLGL